jgi:hypothetical protein
MADGGAALPMAVLMGGGQARMRMPSPAAVCSRSRSPVFGPPITQQAQRLLAGGKALGELGAANRVHLLR